MEKVVLGIFVFFISMNAKAQSWIELGVGSNALEIDWNIEALAVDGSGNVYAAGMITDSNGYQYVAKWDGTRWSELGTGGNALNANGSISAIAVDNLGNVYASGGFTDGTGNRYVAKWNGTTWSKLGTGNIFNATYGGIGSMVTDGSGNVYATGNLTDASGYLYVIKWDGTTWSELGTGNNALKANAAIITIAADSFGNVYAAGDFTDANGFTYVAKWNGTTWSALGTGSNALNAHTDALNAGNAINSIAVDGSGNVYAAGNIMDANIIIYVAKWNGTTWSELGTGGNALNANGYISSIALDGSGNVYAAGNFSDANGYQYVAKWNGTTWSEVGTGGNALNVHNSVINLMTVDHSGSIYVTGDFLDANQAYYVAEYNPHSTISCSSLLSTINQTLCFNEPISNITYSIAGGETGAIVSGLPPGVNGVFSNGIFTISGTPYASGIFNYVVTTSGLGIHSSAYGLISIVPKLSINLSSGAGSDNQSGNVNAPIDTISYTITGNPMVYQVKGLPPGITSNFSNGVCTISGIPTSLGSFNYVVYISDNCAQDSLTGVIVVKNTTTAITTPTTTVEVQVYPNPNNGQFNITLPEATKINVYNFAGVLVTTQSLNAGTNFLNLSNIASGVYSLVTNGTINSYAPVKLVKE